MRFAHFGSGAVVAAHGESVVRHVQYEILSHDGQANEANVAFLFAIITPFFDWHSFKNSATKTANFRFIHVK